MILCGRRPTQMINFRNNFWWFQLNLLSSAETLLSCSAHKEPSCQSPRFSMVHWPSSKTASLGERKAAGTFRSVLLALHFGLVKSCSNPFNLCQLVEGTWDKKTVPCFKDVIFKIASTIECCDYFMWKFGLQDWQEIQPSTARLPQAAAQLLRAGGWKV